MKSLYKMHVCDFCGKNEFEVEHMVAGANAACICNKCIFVGFEGVTADLQPAPAQEVSSISPPLTEREQILLAEADRQAEKRILALVDSLQRSGRI